MVLATYNEVEGIGSVQQLLSQLDQDGGPLLEVSVVDDDSPDGTAQVVRRLSRQDPRVHLLLRCDRSGLASAIRDGLLSASGKMAVVMDEETHQRVLDLNQKLVADLQEATRIVGFFNKWDEVARIKLQIKRSILDQPFGNRALVSAVTERLMDLAKARFQ